MTKRAGKNRVQPEPAENSENVPAATLISIISLAVKSSCFSETILYSKLSEKSLILFHWNLVIPICLKGKGYALIYACFCSRALLKTWSWFWSQNITQVEQFFFFLAKTSRAWLSIIWWGKLFSALSSTCLTIKKSYPPYIIGLSSWIHTSFLALLLLSCWELWSRCPFVHGSKR